MSLSDLSDLKQFAIFYTMEHDRLTKEEKVELVEFIIQSQEIQVKNLLMTGQMSESTTDLYPDMVLTEIAPIALVGAKWGMALLQAALLKKVYNMTRNMMDSARAACKNYIGDLKKKCMDKYKLKAAMREIQMYQTEKGKCGQTKNKDECIAKLNVKIAKAKAKSDKYKLSQKIAESILEQPIPGAGEATSTSSAIVQMATQKANAAAKEVMERAKPTCARYVGAGKRNCRARYERQALYTKMRVFASFRGQCSKAKDPNVCIAKLQYKMKEQKMKADKLSG